MKTFYAIPSLLGRLFLLPIALLLPTVIVQAEQVSSSVPLGDVSYNYNAPVLSDLGAPPGRRGAGSRGSNTCIPSDQIPLTALVPAIQVPLVRDTPEGLTTRRNYESVLSVTTQARPTFWFYIPYRLETISLEFVFQDESSNTLYQTNLSSHSSDDMGVVQITLPEMAPALQPNTRYQWFLVADCHPTKPVSVEGWIERVSLDPTLQLSLEEALPQEQAAIYARNGLWQEAITLLGELYQANPNNVALANDWYSLLESISLEDIAQQPLVDCCTP